MHIALILSGEVRVYKASPSLREITLYEIGPGETCILNAFCIISNTSYPANAVTLTDCHETLSSSLISSFKPSP
jgi:CRP/FNR family transcriptional regulator